MVGLGFLLRQLGSILPLPGGDKNLGLIIHTVIADDLNVDKVGQGMYID